MKILIYVSRLFLLFILLSNIWGCKKSHSIIDLNITLEDGFRIDAINKVKIIIDTLKPDAILFPSVKNDIYFVESGIDFKLKFENIDSDKNIEILILSDLKTKPFDNGNSLRLTIEKTNITKTIPIPIRISVYLMSDNDIVGTGLSDEDSEGNVIQFTFNATKVVEVQVFCDPIKDCKDAPQEDGGIYIDGGVLGDGGMQEDGGGVVFDGGEVSDGGAQYDGGNLGMLMSDGSHFFNIALLDNFGGTCRENLNNYKLFGSGRLYPTISIKNNKYRLDSAKIH